jgi:hypothetical protein
MRSVLNHTPQADACYGFNRITKNDSDSLSSFMLHKGNAIEIGSHVRLKLPL